MNGELLRYSCQLPLAGFGTKAQQKLKSAKVLIVGVGGLGCPASMYLASAGIGTIGLADDDIVSKQNLHRQVLYGDRDLGKQKTLVAKAVLARQNPSIHIVRHRRITSVNAADIISSYDIVVDCTDNFASRYLLNDTCVNGGKPLVYGAIYQYEGQAAVWNVAHDDGSRSTNYRDIFPQIDDQHIPNCADGGVIPTIAGIIGCVQATEVIKLLTGVGELLTGKLLIFNSSIMRSQVIELPKMTTATAISISNTDDIALISQKELTKMLAKNNCQLIDVRSVPEHQKSNLGGKNIPLDQIVNDKVQLDFNKTLVFYCSVGVRSMIAAKHVKRKSPDAKIMSLQSELNL